MMSTLLRRLLDILLSSAFWVCVGLVLLAVLIWYVGPSIAYDQYVPLESWQARAWTIAALVAVVLLVVLWRRWRRSAANASITGRLRELLHSQARASESEEVKLLRRRFHDALAILRRARFGGGGRGVAGWFAPRRYLYELPWYIIIGAPGVGKTTALLNSGLEFPLAKSLGQGAVKGVGGTHNCDWWFTDQAVLIDTAGRYTTHDSDAENDRAEWRGFMALLKKSRSLQPINGVLLTVSVTELLDASAEERRRHLETLRHRLDELRGDLGVSFPVYLLVNKCDLLAGFDEYFATLDRAGREQVWGFTLPWLDEARPTGQGDTGSARTTASAATVTTTAAELALLRQRIQAGLVDTLLAEPDLARRALAHTFAQQFALLCDALQEFGDQLFADSRFSAAPLLRGMYFTSATQAGTPLDRVIRAMSAPVAVASEAHSAAPLTSAPATPRGTAKSYFLTELLSQVVFAEAHLVGHNRRADRRSRALHLAAYAACVLLLAASTLAWWHSYRNNQTYLAEVDGKLARLDARLQALPPTIDGNVYPLLAPLTEAETAPDSRYFRAEQPLWGWTFGLYQGDKLRDGAWPLYETLLRTRLAPTLEARLEGLLRSVAVEDLEFAYEILKAYLMLHEREHFDGAAFKAFVLAEWDANVPAGAAREEREALARHIQALVDLDAVHASKPLDSALVAATRARLTQYTTAQRSYGRLKKLIERDRRHTLPDFSIGAVLGARASVFRRASGKPLTDGVPALYTRRGYEELFAPAVSKIVLDIGRDDGWVLGQTATAQRDLAALLNSGELTLEVKRLYMHDYVAVWERFLGDIDVVMPQSLGEAAELTRMLSAVDSPLTRLLQAVVDETTLLKPSSADNNDASLLARARRSAQATQDDVSRLVGAANLPGAARPQDKPELIVDRRFEALRRAVGGDGAAGEGGAAGGSLAGAVQALAELHLHLSSVEAARIGGYPPPVSDLPARLRAQASRLPLPGRRLLESVADSGGTLVAREARVARSTQMTGTVTRACRETIAGRYPFSAGATREVASEDFARMFAPGGAIDSYFQRELAAVVDTSTSPWRLIPGARGDLGRAEALQQFERAAVIKDVFFRSGGGAPAVTALIKPIEMDASITQMKLDIDGQVVSYRHGPQVGYTVRWPGTRGSRQVRLALEPALGGGADGLVLEGPWALHRLFDRARVTPGDSSERFVATLAVGGRSVQFEVVASSVKNPFALKEMREFSCPAGL